MNAPLQWAFTLQWDDSGKPETRQIFKQQTKDGKVVIGRAPNCDVVLSNPTVSSVNVEIYFDSQQKGFFIKNLTPQNPPFIDGKELVTGTDIPLSENSIILLGNQELKVTSISISNPSPTDYSFRTKRGNPSPNLSVVSPSPNPTQVAPSPNPTQVNPNLSSSQVNPNSSSNQVNSSSNSNQVNPNQNSSQVAPSQNSDNNKNKSWSEKAIVTAIVAAIATIIAAGVAAVSSYYVNENTQKTEKEKAALQRQTEIEKTQAQLYAEKQKLYEERYYKHKQEVLSLIKEKPEEWNKLNLINKCTESVTFAGSFTALNDISETRGWNTVEPKQRITPTYYTKSTGLFLYAHTRKNGKDLIWQGKRHIDKYITHRQFDYIADTFFERDKERVKFYLVNFNLPQYSSTTKTFTCDGDSLELK